MRKGRPREVVEQLFLEPWASFSLMPLLLLGDETRAGERDFSTGLSGWDKAHHSDTSHLLKRFIGECRVPPDIHRAAQ